MTYIYLINTFFVNLYHTFDQGTKAYRLKGSVAGTASHVKAEWSIINSYIEEQVEGRETDRLTARLASILSRHLLTSESDTLL